MTAVRAVQGDYERMDKMPGFSAHSIYIVYMYVCSVFGLCHYRATMRPSVTGPLWGESTGDRWIPLTRPFTRSFDVFFDLRLNKQLSKQTRNRVFETPSRHHDVTVMQNDTFVPRPVEKPSIIMANKSHPFSAVYVNNRVEYSFSNYILLIDEIVLTVLRSNSAVNMFMTCLNMFASNKARKLRLWCCKKQTNM